MSELTKEWLLKTIAELEEERDAVPGAVNEDAAKALAAMKLALASLEAEAMTQVLSSRAGNDTSTIDKALPEGTMLYTAPPAPVAMKDHQIRDLVNELRDIAVEYYGTQQLRERIAKTVRAAMLQGAEPVTTAYKLPDGYVLVPVEPTEEMIAAAMCSNNVLFDKEDDTLFRVQHGEIWRAMLSTAPQQEVR